MKTLGISFRTLFPGKKLAKKIFIDLSVCVLWRSPRCGAMPLTTRSSTFCATLLSYREVNEVALGPAHMGRGWFITVEWLRADKITRPLMTVLLPKATITHDCIDMEFQGHVTPVVLSGLGRKTWDKYGLIYLYEAIFGLVVWTCCNLGSETWTRRKYAPLITDGC